MKLSMFKFNLPVLKKVMPDLYNKIMGDLDEDLMDLYKAGMVDVEYDEDLNAMFRLTDKGQELKDKNDPNSPL